MTPHNIFQTVLSASWQTSLIILLILVVRPVMGARIPARWRSLLWALVLVRLLVPVALLPRNPVSMQNIALVNRPVDQVRQFHFLPRPCITRSRVPAPSFRVPLRHRHVPGATELPSRRITCKFLVGCRFADLARWHIGFARHHDRCADAPLAPSRENACSIG